MENYSYGCIHRFLAGVFCFQNFYTLFVEIAVFLVYCIVLDYRIGIHKRDQAQVEPKLKERSQLFILNLS